MDEAPAWTLDQAVGLVFGGLLVLLYLSSSQVGGVGCWAGNTMKVLGMQDWLVCCFVPARQGLVKGQALRGLTCPVRPEQYATAQRCSCLRPAGNRLHCAG